MDIKQALLFLCLALTISACATPRPPLADHDHAASLPTAPAPTAPVLVPEPKGKLASFFGAKDPQPDDALFFQGLQQLLDPPTDAAAAKDVLERLIDGYPQSKWRNAAEGVLRLIKERDDSQRRLRVEQNTAQSLTNDKDKARQEIEQLQKDLRLKNEKHQAELAALQQENEQLKKDMQLLKDLEIQLNKRDKGLR